MDTTTLLIIVIAVAALLLVGGGGGLLLRRRAVPPAPPAPTPPAGDAEVAEESGAPEAQSAPPQSGAVPAPPEIETPPPSAGRMVRLRARLARSQGALGRGLLDLLSGDRLDEDVWEEIEDTLVTADVGVTSAAQIVENLRTRVKVLGTRSIDEVRGLLREELLAHLNPDLPRAVRTEPHGGQPAVLMVVGVNGTGKTTTCGKLGRSLIGDGRTVVLGAADTFRAAAADQLQTWGERVGASVVRGAEGADPGSVAYDAVATASAQGADVVVVDTAGRLHTKTGLMDELGKVKRVIGKQAQVDEVLLVLDATTGQNGMRQARVFAEVVDITGIVLTKLDGTAKGGIVIQVQRELGVPVKLVGLGEGPDDLAPFDPGAFVDALLEEPDASS